MKCIKTITDKDFGLEEIELKNPVTRFAARGIVVRSDGKIAIFNKSKMNQYKLPGGGCDNNESEKKAFIRECLEETGCEIEIKKCLGYTEEVKSKKNFKQISFCFVGYVKKDLGVLNITKKEKAEGAKLIWVTVNEALSLISNCYDNLKPSPFDGGDDLYSTRFVVKRDRFILEYFINTQQNNT